MHVRARPNRPLRPVSLWTAGVLRPLAHWRRRADGGFAGPLRNKGRQNSPPVRVCLHDGSRSGVPDIHLDVADCLHSSAVHGSFYRSVLCGGRLAGLATAIVLGACCRSWPHNIRDRGPCDISSNCIWGCREGPYSSFCTLRHSGDPGHSHHRRPELVPQAKAASEAENIEALKPNDLGVCCGFESTTRRISGSWCPNSAIRIHNRADSSGICIDLVFWSESSAGATSRGATNKIGGDDLGLGRQGSAYGPLAARLLLAHRQVGESVA